MGELIFDSFGSVEFLKKRTSDIEKEKKERKRTATHKQKKT